MNVFNTQCTSNRHGFVRPVAAIVIGSILLISACRAGSIFDDDYTPPKRVEPAAQPAATNPSPAAPAEAPKPPAVAPKTPPVPNVTAPTPTPSPNVTTAHRALPDRASRAKCRKLFEEIYAKELKDHSPSGRRKLAETLLADAGKTDEGSPDRFALLTGALQAGEEGQNLRACFDAAVQLAGGYDVDELATKVDAASKVFAGPPGAALGSSQNIESLRDLADQLVAEGEGNIANLTKVESAMSHAVPSISNPTVRLEVKNQAHDLMELRAARERVEPALEKLGKSPEDPAANLAAGSYFCFMCGQWDKGLPLLSKSNDPRLKDLAASELAQPEAAQIVKLADGWLAMALKLPAPDRPKANQHAADLYRSAEGHLSGLEKLAVEKKLAQIPPSTQTRLVDLLAMFDPTTSVVAGKWRMQDGVLVSEPVQDGRVAFPYEPPEEYDFKIAFTVLERREAVVQVCYSNGHHFMFAIGGWNNSLAAFQFIKGVGGSENKTAKRKDHWLVVGQHYTSVVKVRRDYVEAYVDGQLVSSFKTDYSDLSIDDYWKLPSGLPIAIGADLDAVRFDTAEIIEITGKGKKLTP